MADETLNRDIAELLGWTDFLRQAEVAGYVLLMALAPGDEERSRVPDYDSDPAACLELLEYVCKVSEQCFYNGNYAYSEHTFELYFHNGHKWDTYVAKGDTLQEAIARACLAALKAVREEETP